MSELKWYWAFDPYLDPPEKQKESAQKAGYVKVVNKSDADKVIAELEEKLDGMKWRGDELARAANDKDKQIEELKEKRDTAEKLLNKALDCVSNGKNHMISLARKKNHSDYKRCLAMASLSLQKRESYKAVYVKADYENWCLKWHKRWLELAEKFKESK